MDQQEGSGEEDLDFQVLPALSPEEEKQLEEEHRQRLSTFYSKNKKYEMDYWYEPLAQFTFPSLSFQLTVHEAYIIHCIYYEYQLTEQDQHAKAKLVEKVDAVIEAARKQWGRQESNEKLFMKLSTRSPKDNCWDYRDEEERDRAIEKLTLYLEKMGVKKEVTSPEKLCNYLYRFFLQNSKQKMGISNSQDFIRIFSRSERIITDINDLSYLKGNVFEKIKKNQLEQEQKQIEFIKVWVRDWSDAQWSQEFRLFYNKYQVTAICQYDERCFFSQLPAKKQQVKKRCLEFFERVRPVLQKISLSQGVVDLIVSEKQVKLIEVNVFDRDARASLYDWTVDEEVLMNGPPQIRVLEKENYISKAHLASMMGLIEKNSTDVIVGALQKLNLIELWE